MNPDILKQIAVTLYGMSLEYSKDTVEYAQLVEASSYMADLWKRMKK